MTGSSSVGRARDMPSLKASDAAILNDSSFESTWWYEPVEDRGAEIDHRVAGEEAAQPRVLQALLDGRDELPRDRAAEDVVDELEVAAARQRIELDLAVAELAVAAGLLLVAAVRLGRRGDRLAIRDARDLEVDLDAEPPLQLRDGDLDVRLSLAGEQQLLGLRRRGCS